MPNTPAKAARASFRLPPLGWAVLALLLLSMVYVSKSGNTYILIDDCLDGELPVAYALVKEGKALAYGPTDTIERLLHGVPRNALRPGLQPLVGLMQVLPPLSAYLCHELLVRLAGLLAMYALLRRYGFPEAAQRGLCAALALAWAVLPTYTVYGVSMLGQPAVVLALLHLRQGPGRWTDWLLLVGFAAWSGLVMAGLFVLVGAGLALAWDAAQNRRVAWRPVLGVVVLAVSYAVVEYPLVYSLLIERQYVPHRVEFDFDRLVPNAGVGVGLAWARRYFLLGHYHSGQFWRYVPLAAAALALLLAPTRFARQKLLSRLGVLLLLLVTLALICGFYPYLARALSDSMPVIRIFNLSRFHFLTPLLWFGVLALSLRYLPAGWLRGGVVALQVVLGLALNTEWTNNVRRLLGNLPASEPTYAAFVASQLFTRIQQDIRAQTTLAPAQYRVACLGFPPAVASLNDFYTLDAYQNNYPLTYKRTFRPLIAAELARSPALQTYFDAWGNRCYLFSAELGKNFRVAALPERVVQHWYFNSRAFQQLGGRYVLSAAKLARPEESGLCLAGDYTSSGAYWHIWLYETQ
ncbi:DUF6044 family protein [Hymenobacter tenuis]